MEQKDYYETLGVDEEAGPDEIKNAYRKLAFQYHPDRTGDDPEATRRMKEVNEAYATLSNPSKRTEYDSLRSRYGREAHSRFRGAYSEEDIFRGSDIHQIFEEFARNFSGFRRPDDFFGRSDFYGTRYKTFQFSRPGFSARGVFFRVGGDGRAFDQTRAWQAGENVGGDVCKPALKVRLVTKLLHLFGRNLLEQLEIPVRGKDLFDRVSISPDRIGTKISYPAIAKWGRAKDLLIKIPAGFRDGQKVKLTGQGEQGRHGGEPGDLFIEIRIRRSFWENIRNFLTGKA